MQWSVNLSKKVVKALNRLPENVKFSLIALIREIEVKGPVRGNWPNYSRLGSNRHHCHLKKRVKQHTLPYGKSLIKKYA